MNASGNIIINGVVNSKNTPTTIKTKESVVRELNKTTSLELTETLSKSKDRFVIQSINQSINQATNQSINQSINHIKQTNKQTINQSITQSINQDECVVSELHKATSLD